MTCFVGVTMCILVSGCWAPVLRYFLCDRQLSHTLPMICVEYTLFLASLVLLIFILEPTPDIWDFEKRGSAFYFTCCMLTCVAVNQITLNAMRFKLIQSEKVAKFFAEDEPFLKTPYGICSEMWHCFFTYLMSLILVFVMDNGMNPRNYALYWCGATLTSGMVTGIALLVGTYAKKLKYSSIANLFYFVVAMWVLSHFLLSNPRYIRCKPCWFRKFSWHEVVLIALNAFAIAFHFFRVLSIVRVPIFTQIHFFDWINCLIKVYARRYEPYMSHNSRFGLTWIIFAAGYGIPCSFVAVYHLLRQTTLEGADTALMHAGSTLQGTFVYLSYSAFSSSEKRYRIPQKVLLIVIALNLLLVITSHVSLLLSLFEKPFHKPCKQNHNVEYLFDKYRAVGRCLPSKESSEDSSSDESFDSEEERIIRMLSRRRLRRIH